MARRPQQQMTMSDRERMELFVAECERLDRHKYIRSGFNPSFTVSMDQGQPWQYSVPEPDQVILESFLIQLRRFMSEGEPIFAHNIRNAARRLLPDTRLRQDLDQIASDWKELMVNDGIAMTLNDEAITLESAWDLYINGEYFHVNMEKRRKLEKHSSSRERGMFRYRFLSQVDYATVYVFAVGRLIRQGLLENTFQFVGDKAE